MSPATDHWEVLNREVARLRAENDQLKDSLHTMAAFAYFDSLTSLRNRRYLDQRMAEELSRLRRHPGKPFSLIAIDLDSFKTINDTEGHAAGDRALVWISNFLECRVRREDVVCRTGGDEFIIFLPETDSAGCHALAASLRAQAEALFARGAAPVAFSIGHATTTGEGGDRVDELLEAADSAMYEDKETKRSTKIAPRLASRLEALQDQTT